MDIGTSSVYFFNKIEVQLNKRRIINLILMLIVLTAVGMLVHRNFGELKKYSFDFRWEFILLAFISEITAYIAKLLIWQRLSGSYGLKIPFLLSAKGYLLSQFGRYIPGKIGLVILRMEALHGHSKKNIAIATGVELVSSIGAACLLVLIGIISASDYLPDYAIWIAVIGFAGVLAFLHPSVFRPLGNLIFKLAKRQPMEEIPPYFLTLKFVFVYILPGLIHGLSLFLVLLSLSPISFGFYLTITSVYYAAGLIGLAALFAPSGIGVREGVMMLVLPLFIDAPVVIVGVIIIRLITTAAEVFLAGAFTLLAKLFQKQDPATEV